jgi:hypothetical protein
LAYARIVEAHPGFTFAMMVNPLATVFGMGDPNFPGFTSAPGLGSASARGFIAPSVRCFRICSVATPPVMRPNA